VAQGVAINWAAAPERKARAELLARACDGNTRALAVSGAQFLNGYLPDLPRLAECCRERDIWLCVDGIQGLGNRAWDLPSLGVDFLAAGGQKWLLSPKGSGLLYVSDRALAALAAGELRQALLGWLNTERWQFTDLLDYDRPLSRDARLLEVGTYPFHDNMCLGHSLDLISSLGPERIAAHSDALRDRFLERLEEKGLLAPAGPYRSSTEGEAPERCGQIIALACPDAMALWKKLMAAKVAVNPREGGIRVSFHYYNRESDLERLIAEL
jgi:cysteine desulfurase/selenocysteine lyase